MYGTRGRPGNSASGTDQAVRACGRLHTPQGVGGDLPQNAARITGPNPALRCIDMPAYDKETPCPICGEALRIHLQYDAKDISPLSCTGCGEHAIRREAAITAQRIILRGSAEEACFAHAVHRLREGEVITLEWLTSVEKSALKLPDAHQQVDMLILHLAEVMRPGSAHTLLARRMRAVVGAVTLEETRWVMEEAKRLGLIEGRFPEHWTDWTGTFLEEARLTLDGWAHAGALRRQGAGSRYAFMAMRFSEEMFTVYRDHMAPAVARADFELRTTADGHKPAGNIDNRMRVEIRTSRFVVCDLSDGNQGAYWEAGFAEGIGRPVIYTCRKDVLDANGVHFDTRQQLIIPWDPADMAQAMRDLTNVIRATLPAEAKLTDD